MSENRSQFTLGAILVALGVVILGANLLQVSVGAFLWPALLIAVGVWFIMRPRMAPAGRAVTMKLLGDIKRRGSWAAQDEEIWAIIGDVDLDYSHADLPVGETRLRVYGFVGDLEVMVPEGIGVAIQSTAMVCDAKLFGEKQESFVAPVRYATPGYAQAERKLRVETVHFVCDLKAHRV